LPREHWRGFGQGVKKPIPIPGFKTVKQVEENAGAMQFGPLTKEQMKEVDSILNIEP